MQDPNADTEWNDALRARGIIPPKETEITEDDLVGILEQTVQEKTQGKGLDEMNLGELNEAEDDIDEEEERIFEMYRQKRLQEMRAAQERAKFGDVLEISKADYVQQVNKAGEGVWVVLHVYKPGIPLCTLVNQHIYNLARKFPETKFLKSVSSVCIPNYPDKNLPTVFVYFEGDMKKQFVGPLQIGGMNLTQDDLEWMLSECGAVKSELEERPRKEVRDVMSASVKNNIADGDSDNNDW